MINQQTGNLIRQKAVTPAFDFGTIKGIVDKFVQNYDAGLEARALGHIVENWDSIPQRIKDLKKKGGSKAKKNRKGRRHSCKRDTCGSAHYEEVRAKDIQKWSKRKW